MNSSHKINPYDSFTASDLHSELMQINNGDAMELHNALLVLCNVVSDMNRKIENIEKQLSELRMKIPPVNAISQLRIEGK